MRNQWWYVVGFMFVVTAVCSVVLIGFARVTEDRVAANQRLALEEAVVRVLPIELGPDASNAEIHKAFVEQVGQPREATGGAYTLERDGRIEGYAVPIGGQGFWAPIAGMVGVKADKRTVTGIWFYEQNETPGLGAEITQEPFREQFVGKILGKGEMVLAIRPAAATIGESEVHAITGATQTSTRVEKFLNEDVRAWRAKVR